jgi:hypothetical protein
MSMLAFRFPLTSRSLSADDPLPLHLRRRAWRVCLLTAAIAVMSMADLSMTLTYLKSVGMGEANPIARYVMGFNSPSLLAVWKCASVTLACLIFILTRHRKSAEIACWTCAAALLALCLGWIQYANEAHKLTPTLQAVEDTDSALWISMTSHNHEPAR